MGTVHIGIGHQDDAVVAQLGRGRNRSSMPVPRAVMMARISSWASILSGGGLFHVQNFTAQGQDGLETAVAALFGGAAGGFTFHQVQFAVRGVFLGAVGQLAGQGAAIQAALS